VRITGVGPNSLAGVVETGDQERDAAE